MKTKWRWIPGYEKLYRISNKGKVRSVPRYAYHGRTGTAYKISGKLLKVRYSTKGYQVVGLMNRGNQKMFHVHSLVLLTFSGPKPINGICRHLDGNKLNNRITNLKWGTNQQNSDDRAKHGGDKRMPKGEKHWNSKLSEKDVRKIRRLFNFKGWLQKEIAERFNVSRELISVIVNYNNWKNVI